MSNDLAPVKGEITARPHVPGRGVSHVIDRTTMQRAIYVGDGRYCYDPAEFIMACEEHDSAR